jgi:trans-aconitate 2-methyltransferase
MHMELLEWDAQSYDALPLPHKRWGPHTIGRLRLTGDETVADVGCGTGRDAEHLLELLPAGRVLAIDGSQQMLAQTRSRVAGAGHADRVEIIQADLRDPAPAALATHPPVDAAVSVATLHWLPDHAQVFRTVAGLLQPGGQFAAEAGGRGNIASIVAVLSELGAGDGTGIWNFADVPETMSRLAAAGFAEIEVNLVPNPARLDAGRQFEAYLATVVLGAHLRELPPEDRAPFVREVAARLAEPVVDYVRLQIRATRS